MEKYNKVSQDISKLITRAYSTSFSLGVWCLDESVRAPVYSIYGFVRLADEIVDTFHDFDKKKLIFDFEQQYYQALKDGISLNPVLNAFALVVKKYNIEDELVQAFLNSMKSDLEKKTYDEKEIKEYVYGSADVVGLMCLRIFTNKDEAMYERLKPFAMSLGSAFQKINFLRDIKNDSIELNRVYFPEMSEGKLDDTNKSLIIKSIEKDFVEAKKGIVLLPDNSRFGVYVAYLYYLELTKKIKNIRAESIYSERISVSNLMKIILLITAFFSVKVFRKI
jgi:15-cis-phytoene synthase